MRSIGIFLALIFLNSCSTFQALKSPSSEYRDYVETNLGKAEVYDSGRLMIVLKAIPGTQRLKVLQESLAPGFGFEKKEEVYQVIAALSLSHPGGYSKSDIKISLNDYEVLRSKEISGAALLETLYFFAYPYQRVFVLEFSKEVAAATEKKIRVKTPRGEVSLVIQEPNDGN